MERVVWAELEKTDLDGSFRHDTLCTRNDMPCVQISKETRARYMLRWDYNTHNLDNWDRACRLRGKAINQVLFNAFKTSTSSKRANFHGSLLTGSIQGLTLEEARKNAASIFKIIDTAVHGGVASDMDAYFDG